MPSNSLHGSALIFPGGGGTTLALRVEHDASLPAVTWLGWASSKPVDVQAGRPGTPMLVEQSQGAHIRPGLRGHRLADPSAPDSRDVAGRDWSSAFRITALTADDHRLVIEAADLTAGLELRTEVESLIGGALRARHTLTNRGRRPYLVDGLEVSVPVPDICTELLDFTGRHELERVPQRHHMHDGLWLRESRGGRPGLDAASILVAGQPGFGFGCGVVCGILVASSGNSTLAVQRNAATAAFLAGGELLMPGELVLAEDETYTTPWVVIAAATDGLDGLAASLHTWERGLTSHPATQPVTLNVWEAVFFDHDLPTLKRIADRAAEIGVERFVLDDGWFHRRRDDHAGLGDWWVDPEVWPDGLTPLIQHVHQLDMKFGLWFEPEMVNPDSDLYRAHPDWILSASGRTPLMHRNQHVLDLTNNKVWGYLLDKIDAVLGTHDVDYVKWDHNRDLLEAGSALHGHAPAGHHQTRSYYALLDELRRRHPNIAWESCAAGGGRIDLAVLERVQRVWTSDNTDALARQHIQRWTAQFIAPEYLGAHISAPLSHQTGRTFSLDFRAATAFFGAFGIEWNLSHATQAELDRLAWWIRLYRRHRPLLHSGRMIRIDVTDPAVYAHGVIAADGRSALVAHVQLEESSHNRGTTLHVPGLHTSSLLTLDWASPPDPRPVSGSPGLDPAGPTGGAPTTGASLADIGIWLPRRRPETIQLILVAACP